MNSPLEMGFADTGSDLYFKFKDKYASQVIVARQTRLTPVAGEHVGVDGIYINDQNTYGLVTIGGCDTRFAVIYLGKLRKQK
jgi:hypothetical protein